jgi:hypothetical protein
MIAGVYFGAVVLLYAPFWQGGAVLRVFSVNPAASRNINTLAAFLGQFYNAVAAALGAPLAPPVGSPAEHFMHLASMALFLVLYGVLCWQALHKPYWLRTLPAGETMARAEPSHRGQTGATTLRVLVRWWAIVELLYCALGTPWSWPWYAVTFFGLYALFEAYQERNEMNSDVQWSWLGGREKSALYIRLPLAVRLLSFSMLTLYCFYAWGPQYSFVPGLPRFEWAYFSGLWVWLLPLLALGRNLNFRIGQRYHFKYTELPD